MDEVRKPINSVCYTPSSEFYRIYKCLLIRCDFLGSDLRIGHFSSNESRLTSDQIYTSITTCGQSASLSWYQAPIWGLWPDFYYYQTIAGFWYGAPTLTRGRVCLLQCAMYNIEYILLSQIWDSPNLEDQVPVFISPRNRVARLYPQALGWLTDSNNNISSLYISGTDRI
jgi:hypothetical protein